MLVRGGFLAREFCSIEEYLGQPRNQQRYYAMLTEVARGHWTPENLARPWVRYCLEAHYIQALSVLRRVRESERVWDEIGNIVMEHDLQPRTMEALFDATVGLKVRNASYRATLAESEVQISMQTVTNDLRELVNAGLLEQKGFERARTTLDQRGWHISVISHVEIGRYSPPMGCSTRCLHQWQSPPTCPRRIPRYLRMPLRPSKEGWTHRPPLTPCPLGYRPRLRLIVGLVQDPQGAQRFEVPSH